MIDRDIVLCVSLYTSDDNYNPNPKPQTPNLKPQTPNPEPQTPNPKP